MSDYRDPLDVLATVAPGLHPPPTGESEGAAAEAIRTAESALAQQNSLVAQVDLQVVTAVLSAHTNHANGVEALQRLQDEIEGAVITRTDLDTPAGAREFQRYLLGKLRDIRTVVDSADLDATSQATLAAALASLYASTARAAPDSEVRDPTSAASRTSVDTDADPLGDLDPRADAGPGPLPAPGDYPPEDFLPGDFLPGDYLPGAAATPPAAAPAAWGSGAPTAAPPFSGGLPTLPTAGSPVFGSSIPGSSIPGFPDLPAQWPDEKTGRSPEPEPMLAGPADAVSDSDEDASPEISNADDLTVTLPDGQTVTASSPQLAAVIADAVGGTAIREAFSAQGIILPPTGTEPTELVEPARLVPGDVGLFSDRYALALGNGQMLLDNVIQPVGDIADPGFLGWQPPPEPVQLVAPEASAPNDQTAAG